MKTEIEVLFTGGNTIVFQSKLRGYPSITLQGDTLFLLFSRAEHLKKYLDKELSGDDLSEDLEEVLESADHIYSTLKALNHIYWKYADKQEKS